MSPSLINLMVSVDVKHHVYLLTDLHSVSLKVRDIQVRQPSMALALVPVAIMISSKK